MNKSQFIVLLCVAAWITVATLITLSQGYSPEFWLRIVFVRSIPAVAFGAVLFWWMKSKAK